MKKAAIVVLAVASLISTAGADSATLSFNQYGTDNLFQNRDKVSDQISSLSFSLDENFSRVSLFTEGDFSYLFQNPDLSVYRQEIGVDYVHPLSDRSALYVSFTGGGSFFRSDFKDFNFISFTLFSAFKRYLSPTSILQANYSLQYRDYSLSAFDSYSHSLSVTLDKYFQTKTTLKAEVNWGYKYFLSPYLSQEPESVYSPSPMTYQNTTGMMGKGHGKSYMQTPQRFFLPSDGKGQGIQVLSLGGLVAQGVGSRIGLRLSGMKQWNLSGENPFSTIEEYYMIENPSYDGFSWSGHMLEGRFTWLIPGDIQLKIEYIISDKMFPGIENLSLDGEGVGTIRRDDRKQLQVRLEKNFPRFSLFLHYARIENQSNDVFFDWQGHFLSLGMQWNLFFGERKK